MNITLLSSLLTLTTLTGFSLTIYYYRKLKKTLNILAPMNDISTELIGSSEQILGVSRDLKSASQEQMDTLTTTISTSHEINAMMNRTNDNTKDLTGEAEYLSKMTIQGRQSVSTMVQTSLEMKKGSEYFRDEMQKNMDELYQTMNVIKEISEKTKLINDIVFQTKLLSFNASVEAARAGESGKGFSVVAEEIGKLAKMSGHTADEISRIVEHSTVSLNGAITKTKNKADELILENLRKNDEGYQSTLDCEIIFNEIAGKISLINETIQEISLATKEQSIGINQLDTAIIKLQEVADRNTLVASQSTEHAHEFEKQTANLVILCKEIDAVKNKDKKETPVFHKFEWNDKLVLGVKSMDDEHKVLIEKINAFISALENQYIKKDKNFLMSTFVDLANYTTHHFKDEEAYMESISYPQLNSHRKIHENLLNQVGQYGKQIEEGTINDKKVISFLRNWLLSHIMGVDMQYTHHHKPAAKKVKLAA